MNIGVVLIALSVLIMAWALERIFTRIQTVERHIIGLRKRIKTIEKRVMKGKTSTAKPSTATRTIGFAPQNTNPKPKQKSMPTETVCSFCGTKYSMELDKCPKCNHINIEKYRVRRNTSSKNADEDLDI